jgi:hypothetical protein
MIKDQSFEHDRPKDFVYYPYMQAADDFDLTIRAVPADESGAHAKVELVFFQNKGNDKQEVVLALQMQLWQVDDLVELINRKKKAFLEGNDG